MTCEHKNHIHSTETVLCSDCGAEICTACGTKEKHSRIGEWKPGQPLLSTSFCRECAERFGYGKLFYVEIDRDLLDAYLGKESAALVIQNCERKR